MVKDFEPLIVFLDVGHGNSTIVLDTGGVVVIDAGPKSYLLEFLREQGIRYIDLILISHADQDHIAGLIALMSCGEFQIGSVRVNTDSHKGSAIWDDLIFELDILRSSGELDFQIGLTTNNTGEFNSGEIQIEVLGPSTYLAGKGPGSKDRQGRRISTNAISAVIRLSHNNGKPIALLPGDLDEVGLDDLTRHNKASLCAPILVFPHHGGRAGGTDMVEFTRRVCALINPELAIFSIARGKKYPRPEIIAALRESLPSTRIACTQLSEYCASQVSPIEPSHLCTAFSAGREHRKCCAGTVMVHIQESYSILPEPQAHSKFIENIAPTALCRKPSSG